MRKLTFYIILSILLISILFYRTQSKRASEKTTKDLLSPQPIVTLNPSETPKPTNKPSSDFTTKKSTATNSPIPNKQYNSSIILKSVSPNPANSGTTITLKGSGFGPSNHRVWFYNNLGLSLYSQIDSWNDTSISTRVPNLSQGNFEIQVEKSDGTKSNRVSFSVGAGQPIISSYPLTTNFGSKITLGGKSFGTNQGKVNIQYANDVSSYPNLCMVDSWADNQIICNVPSSLSHGLAEYGFQIVTSDNRQSSMVYIKIN